MRQIVCDYCRKEISAFDAAKNQIEIHEPPDNPTCSGDVTTLEFCDSCYSRTFTADQRIIYLRGMSEYPEQN